MRTLVSSYEPTILDAIIELDKKGIIEFVNIFCEQTCSHEKNISRLDFLAFGYSAQTLALINKYSQGVDYDETVYNNLYKNMYRYMCNIGRHNKDYQSVSDTDYIHSFNLMYKFLYGYLQKEKIELVIFDHEPHAGWDDVLYDLCVELGIKTIILQTCFSPLSNIPFLQYAFNKEDGLTFDKMQKKYRGSNENLIEDFNYNHCYMQHITRYEVDRNCPYFSFSLKRHHLLVALLRFGFSKQKCQKYIHEKISKNLANHAFMARKLPLYIQYDNNRKKYTRQPNYHEKFVYFPLHLQPEVTTAVNGGIYCDQILAIERLAKLIPEDWYIYVKENPKQNEYMRGEVFFKRLHLIKNVKYIDVSVPSPELLKHCQFCASIDGTASFESICGGKPTLIFGRVWWDFLPGVFKYHKELNIKNLMNYQIDKKELKEKYNEYLTRTMIGTLYPPEMCRKYCPELTKEVNTQHIADLLKDLIAQIYLPRGD